MAPPLSQLSDKRINTATALLGLVEQGKVNLDRPVNDYLRTVQVSPMRDVSKAW
jgi:CubicO group peptidase (beta-lactamase class C family)